jgi:hypothetical protein
MPIAAVALVKKERRDIVAGSIVSRVMFFMFRRLYFESTLRNLHCETNQEIVVVTIKVDGSAKR